jgi:hypothetical protein
VTFYCTVLLQAAFAQIQTGHPDTTGWDVLFKKDLSNAILPKGIWTFSDGVLTADADEVIWTRKKFDNFILDLEFRTDEGTNSGVIVYCSNIDDWIPNSVEIQIADDYSEKWASSPKTWQCGAIFGHLAPTESMVREPGEWNRYTITCRDSMIYVVLNDSLVNTMNMNLWISAENNPDGSEIPSWLSRPLSDLPTQGHIGLQGKHAGAPIFFRNLKIKEIE